MAEPVLLGLLFADRVITEDNGKRGIIGTFTRFYAQNYPIVFAPWAIYVAFTNAAGEHEFALNLVHPDTNQVIAPISGRVQASSADDVIELSFVMQNALFPRPGRYVASVFIDGDLLASRILQVDQSPTPPHSPAG
ncbi:MAG: hypothetical protein K1X75_11585 [Leptospirales bacterium]|nr:hypothetical protein [Leptospirales bacterium]